MYRLTALAATALAEAGITEPRDHILIARVMQQGGDEDTPEGVGTMLVSKKPFSDAAVSKFETLARDMRFDPVLTPGYSLDDNFAAIASGRNLKELTDNFPLNISAPTDDNPFFFQMLRRLR